MSPQNWLCRSERNPALDTLASPLGHFNGDQRTLLHQTDKNLGDSKTQSLTRPTTHPAFSTFSTFPFLTIYSTRVLQHQKQTKYSMLQIKTFFVVLLKRSFVIHLCCLKNIVLEKLTISRNAIYISFGKSLLNIKNNKDPSTDLWQTLEGIFCVS